MIQVGALKARSGNSVEKAAQHSLYASSQNYMVGISFYSYHQQGRYNYCLDDI